MVALPVPSSTEESLVSLMAEIEQASGTSMAILSMAALDGSSAKEEEEARTRAEVRVRVEIIAKGKP